MRRRLLVLAIIPISLALAGVGLLLWAMREGIVNRVNYERVQVGMPQERVEQLFGGPGEPGALVGADGRTIDELNPPTDATIYVSYRNGQAAVPSVRRRAASACFWEAAAGNGASPLYVVVFDLHGKVLCKAGYDTGPAGVFTRLRYALGF